jgi:hypothetical protein
MGKRAGIFALLFTLLCCASLWAGLRPENVAVLGGVL